MLGEFIKNQRRNEYPLMITDLFNKMIKTVTMKCRTAAELARHLVSSWVYSYGPPAELIANNVVCFMFKFLIDVYNTIFIQNNFTTT